MLEEGGGKAHLGVCKPQHTPPTTTSNPISHCLEVWHCSHWGQLNYRSLPATGTAYLYFSHACTSAPPVTAGHSHHCGLLQKAQSALLPVTWLGPKHNRDNGAKNRQFIAVTTKQHKWRTHTYTLSSGSISWINNIILIFQKLHNGPHHRVWNWEKTLNYIQSNSLSLFKYFFKNCFTILIFILFLFFGHTLLHVGS